MLLAVSPSLLLVSLSTVVVLLCLLLFVVAQQFVAVSVVVAVPTQTHRQKSTRWYIQQFSTTHSQWSQDSPQKLWTGVSEWKNTSCVCSTMAARK